MSDEHIFCKQVTYHLRTETSQQAGFYLFWYKQILLKMVPLLAMVPTLLIFSSSRSSPNNVAFSFISSGFRSLSCTSISSGGPFRYCLNSDCSNVPVDEHEEHYVICSLTVLTCRMLHVTVATTHQHNTDHIGSKTQLKVEVNREWEMYETRVGKNMNCLVLLASYTM